MAVYYILDLEYPRMYSQLLGILQTHLLQLPPYAGMKSAKYRTFSTEMTQAMASLQDNGQK
jgi:hypothetical protein